jgi:hypothetical protein
MSSVSGSTVQGNANANTSYTGGGLGLWRHLSLDEILVNALVVAIPIAIVTACIRAKSRSLSSSSKQKGVTNDDSKKDIIYEDHKNGFNVNAMVARIKSSNSYLNPVSIEAMEPFGHQVAGHTTEVLRKMNNKILKPLNKAKLFWHEVSIYEGVKEMGNHCSQSMKSFVAEYHGVITVKLGDKILPHIVLDDLTHNFKYPCCMDIKMGRQTFEPSAEDVKKNRELKKYSYQSTLGFRITGFKVYDVVRKLYRVEDKTFGRSLQPHQIQGGLSHFFNNGKYIRRDVLIATIAKLENILLWMKSQVDFHFYCSSILVVYEGDINIDSCAFMGGTCGSVTDKVRVKLIDLAHAVPSNDPRSLNIYNSNSNSNSTTHQRYADEGYLFGLTNLISYLHAIVKDLDNKGLYDRS